MADFSKRSEELELLDLPGATKDELWQNMAELDIINKLLGGHNATISGLEKIMKQDPGRIWRITDLGCGGGDTLRVIAKWAKSKGYKVILKGVDLDPHIIDYAIKHTPLDNPISYYCMDFESFSKSSDSDCDVRTAALFAHHLYRDELKSLLKCLDAGKKGFVLNDLHRHPLAWWGIKILTRFLSKSRLVKNDAPLSVERGFTKIELTKALNDAGITGYSISWVWAFRFRILKF